MHPRASGQGVFPRYGGGWMHQFGHVYALQQELLNPQASNWFRAVELWHTARHEGVALNSAHYTSILRQCVQPKAWEASLRVLRQMQREGIRPDVVGVGCVLATCADADRISEVEEVFDEFSGKMALDSVCYLALIKAKMAGGRWKEAIAVGKRQEADGLHFLPYTYTHLLEAAKEADDGEFGLELVRRMKREQWELSERGRVAFKKLCVLHNWEAEFDRLGGFSEEGVSRPQLPERSL
ncbi:hypothetical protein C3747_42g170 [Trypanosoma cruzi]|uniref:Pentacotripeptide-repeat region of PRORP domain-containing protein n=2 Tax=Trypanosoma cruzi TaxID=5693 RepID=Q4CT39_TRYCC|nr:hypothetical protein, conserved [Trypanosoma cruzi]EAN83440.1 hypothetical protein, conserved [Trypanosoma cruzi]PWV13646.1 hypothetical protein C3747_42g173 [Trypanosoma cruzi]PWV13649.1 hypothetical protein C3747_42g170 [Trypanosoma cruzi]RNC44746.1 hypothetical protein TcCL_NonESM05495 [Trypanosoma cruzi]|eukprot:XP_805291.1 hypothetical protein [Trypanosoma cruzi strain CL Brener]